MEAKVECRQTSYWIKKLLHVATMPHMPLIFLKIQRVLPNHLSFSKDKVICLTDEQRMY